MNHLSIYDYVVFLICFIVAVFFLPIYIKNHIYTKRQFLSVRYNNTMWVLFRRVFLSYFLPGFFWKRTTWHAALTAAMLTIQLSVLFKFLPQLTYSAVEAVPF